MTTQSVSPEDELQQMSVYDRKIILARLTHDTNTEAAESLGFCRQTVATTLKRYPGLVQKLRVALTQKLNS